MVDMKLGCVNVASHKIPWLYLDGLQFPQHWHWHYRINASSKQDSFWHPKIAAMFLMVYGIIYHTFNKHHKPLINHTYWMFHRIHFCQSWGCYSSDKTSGAPPTKAVIGEPADFRGWCERWTKRSGKNEDSNLQKCRFKPQKLWFFTKENMDFKLRVELQSEFITKNWHMELDVPLTTENIEENIGHILGTSPTIKGLKPNKGRSWFLQLKSCRCRKTHHEGKVDKDMRQKV